MRTPIAYTDEGALVLAAAVPHDAKMRIAYGDPEEILHSVMFCGGEIAEFRPDAILLFTCGVRRTFWNDEGTNRETAPFQDVAPTAGFYTAGELLRMDGRLLEHNSTGDGLMTACQFLAAVVRSGKSVTEAANVMTHFPQTLINVRDVDKNAVDDNAAVADVVAQVKAELGEDGSVLLRPSGTEPVVRVMVQATQQDVADEMAARIADVVAREPHV
jgi:hypothetical protein